MVGDSRLVVARFLLHNHPVDIAEDRAEKAENTIRTSSSKTCILAGESKSARCSSCFSVHHDLGYNSESTDDQSDNMGIDYRTDHASFHCWTYDERAPHFYAVPKAR